MKPLPTSILCTQDHDLVRRLQAFLRSITALQVVDNVNEAGRLMDQLDPTVLILDMRTNGSQDLLIQARDEWPHSLPFALGVPRSEPHRAAHLIGVFAFEDVNGDRQRMQAQVSRAVTHLRLQIENQELKAARSANGPPPVASRPANASNTRFPLSHLLRASRSFENVDAVLDAIVEGITSSMMISRAGLFCCGRDSREYKFRAGIRCMDSTTTLSYAEGSPLVTWLEVQAHLVSRDNLEHVPRASERALLKQALDALGAEVIIPLHARGRMMGWLFVGHLSTGFPFTPEVIEELIAVADHCATTLENALLYEEVAVQKTLAETVLQSMPTGIVAIGTDGVIRWYNNAAEEILDMPAHRVMEKPVEALGTQLADLLRRTLEPDAHEEASDWMDKRTQRSLSVHARPLRDRGTGLGAVALVHDRTTENALREKEEQLERAAFWTELAASMSHEVRNPLVAIKTFAQLLPDRYEDEEFREQFSELVSKEVDRLNHIIEQIDDFAHPPELQFDAIDLDDALRKGLDLAALRIPQNGVTVDANLHHQLPLVRGDRQALTECFAQLITNAMEASRGRKSPVVKIDAEEVLPANGSPGLVRVTVVDNGTGIPEEIQSKVFSPFCTTKARGMGLGLPIVRRTIIDHNGRVHINTSKKGTTVSVTLPSANGDE